MVRGRFMRKLGGSDRRDSWQATVDNGDNLRARVIMNLRVVWGWKLASKRLLSEQKGGRWAMRTLRIAPVLALVVGGLCLIGSVKAGTLEALWYFDDTGADETGQHPCTLFGNATYVPTPGASQGGFGLYTEAQNESAQYAPAIEEIGSGQIFFEFKLAATFRDGSPPIIIINSNRQMHRLGDFSIRLETDGKMSLVQEQEGSEDGWTLKTSKEAWDPDIWYKTVVTVGTGGRSIEVTWDVGSDFVSDEVSTPWFSSNATDRTIGLQQGAEGIGLTIDWLAVCSDVGGWPCDLPASVPEPLETRPGLSWGRLKSLYR